MWAWTQLNTPHPPISIRWIWTSVPLNLPRCCHAVSPSPRHHCEHDEGETASLAGATRAFTHYSIVSIILYMSLDTD